MPHREVDLAFKDEKQQNNFVRALIYQINTVDGAANSAKNLTDAILSHKKSLYFEQYRIEMPQSEIDEIRAESRLKLCKVGYLRYSILKFRMKISFIALKKQMTVLELFCNAILKSYVEMVEEGIIQV